MTEKEKDKRELLIKDLYRQAFKKFKLLRIRMKISYEAFTKENTVLELFLRAIINTYNHLKHEGKIRFT